jgi:hypothetical protein
MPPSRISREKSNGYNAVTVGLGPGKGGGEEQLERRVQWRHMAARCSTGCWMQEFRPST